MRHDGSRLPQPWGSWLGLLLWLSLFFCLLAQASPAHAQTPSERLASIERELTYSLATCGRLANELGAQSGRLASLGSDLAALRESLEVSRRKIDDLQSELEASRQLSTDLRVEISRLKDLLASSLLRLDELSATFDSYRAAMERQVKLLERRVTGWKVAAGVSLALALAAAVWAAVK